MTEPFADRDTTDDVASPEATSSSRPRRRWWLPLLIFLALVVVLRGLVLETFYVPSGSMEPTLHGGDRIVVWKPGAGSVHRGEVIVFDGTTAFGPSRDQSARTGIGKVVHSIGSHLGVRAEESDYVKRVIGLPGDHVQMTAQGVVSVNGTRLREPYADTHDPGPAFDIAVPPGRLWVMGDNRCNSDDSRAHLGDPGGGTIPLADVIGKAVGRYWPLSDIGGLPSGAASGQGHAS